MNIITPKRQNKSIRPDFVIKDIPREERGNLPPRMKVLLFLHIHHTTVPAWMFEDCKKRYPEYFERDSKLFTVS